MEAPDTPIIVSAAEYRRLKRIRPVWWLGWAFGLVSLLVGLYVMSLLQARLELEQQFAVQVKRLDGTVTRVEQVQAEQEQYGSLLITWGEYIKERTRIASQNMGAPNGQRNPWGR